MEKKGKERLIFPAFDLYGKLIGDINGDKQITMFVYEIRINHIYALTLNNIPSRNPFLVTTLMNPPRKNKIVNI